MRSQFQQPRQPGIFGTQLPYLVPQAARSASRACARTPVTSLPGVVLEEQILPLSRGSLAAVQVSAAEGQQVNQAGR